MRYTHVVPYVAVMYRLRHIFSLIVLTSLHAAHADLPLEDADIPVAPIRRSLSHGWTNALVLENPAMRVVILPSLGRISSIQLKAGPEFLHIDDSLIVPSASDQKWKNRGGEWLWPVAQEHWLLASGRAWPPPDFIDERAWSGHAWIGADGSQSCRLTREYGDPLHVTITRVIQIDPERQLLTIRQKAQCSSASSIPMALWNLLQIDGAGLVVMPVDAGSSFPMGYKTLMFDSPTAPQLHACDACIVYDASLGGEHKLGADSRRNWIAAQKGEFVIVQKADESGVAHSHPDGGCRVEMYSNGDLGYTEIETLSSERVLEAGEQIQNTVTIQCYALETNMPPCSVAAQIMGIMGDTPNR